MLVAYGYWAHQAVLKPIIDYKLVTRHDRVISTILLRLPLNSHVLEAPHHLRMLSPCPAEAHEHVALSMSVHVACKLGDIWSAWLSSLLPFDL